ncbi:MAG: hypothetical protein QNK11_01070 [Legionella sp.]|nr:hypothetical protein [Legionella sp.]
MTKNTYHDKEDSAVLEHRREVKRMLEEKLEEKRIKNELEDFDSELEGEFDWDELDRDNKG